MTFRSLQHVVVSVKNGYTREFRIYTDDLQSVVTAPNYFPAGRFRTAKPGDLIFIIGLNYDKYYEIIDANLDGYLSIGERGDGDTSAPHNVADIADYVAETVALIGLTAPADHTHSAAETTDFNASAAAAAPVQSVNGETGDVVLDADEIGSTAVPATVLAAVTNVQDALAALAAAQTGTDDQTGEEVVTTAAVAGPGTAGGSAQDYLDALNAYLVGLTAAQVASTGGAAGTPTEGSTNTQAAIDALNGEFADYATLANTNTWTGEQHIESGAPLIWWKETDASVDNRLWRMYAQGGAFHLETLNDGVTAAASIMSVQRTGTVVDSVTFSPSTFQINGNLNAIGAVTLGAQGEVVQLKSDRPWNFESQGSGSSTALQLRPTTGGKLFHVRNNADTINAMTFNPDGEEFLCSGTIDDGDGDVRVVPLGSPTSGTLTQDGNANKQTMLTGAVVLDNSQYNAGDIMVWNASSASRAISKTGSFTMYVNGVTQTTATLAARGTCGVQWRTTSEVYLTGDVS